MNRCIFILSLLIPLGCASEPDYPLRSHVLQPITASALPGVPDLPAETTIATWQASSDRLGEDIPRAVKRSGWGLLSIEVAPVTRPAEQALPIRGQALLPDGRLALIHAWVIDEDRVAAAIQVGHFGDAAQQSAFLQMLADTLADKPKPKRGGLFFLPEPASPSDKQ